jgi:ABC-type multidrug transport system ATPase subunit
MDTVHYTIEARDLSKSFGRAQLLTNISFALATGESLAVTGPNGSGKSTLLMILAGLQKPTRGTVIHRAAAEIHRDDWSAHIGYTGPLLNPYEELTAVENMTFAARDRATGERIESLLKTFNLTGHRDKRIKHYSSGMKQRLKIILSILNDPPVLILDEPGTNLDAEGKELLRGFMESVRTEKIIVIATNDPAEASLCAGGIRLG